MESIVQLYETLPEVVSLMVTFTLEGEQGLDMDGLKREVYFTFWERAFEKFFEGKSTFVPRIGPDIQDNHYQAIGRVVSHCYLLTGIFPTAISKVFATALLVGKNALSADDYISGFLEHVFQYDRMRLESALAKSSLIDVFPNETAEFLCEFLSEYGVVQNPTPASLKQILANVAKTELIAKPSVAINEIRTGMLAGSCKELWGDFRKEDVDELYDRMKLTTSKLLGMIQVDEMVLTKPQSQVLQFLKQYIRSLSPKELQLFLRYVTGSCLPVVKNVKVVFHTHAGTVPMVFIHTCSAIIDLPDGGYTGYTDFRVQMANTLLSPESWRFTSL